MITKRTLPLGLAALLSLAVQTQNTEAGYYNNNLRTGPSLWNPANPLSPYNYHRKHSTPNNYSNTNSISSNETYPNQEEREKGKSKRKSQRDIPYIISHTGNNSNSYVYRLLFI